jgi:hypothetical protein
LKKLIAKYAGILTGAVYGLVMRLIFETKYISFDFADLFSITFIWVVPVIIGITPLFFATKEQLANWPYRFLKPVSAVLLFFLFCFWMGKEDIVCLIIISLPYLLAAGIGGMLFGFIILRYRKKKGILYTIFFLPFITGLAEHQLPIEPETYTIESSILINANANDVWQNIVRVHPIADDEYTKGLFNYAGIPRPLYAELDKDTLGAERIGHFEDGLIFREKVTEWKRNEKISLNIQVVPNANKKTILEQHILHGKHFSFLNATYSIKIISPKQTLLTLSSSYKLDTRINGYGSFWGNMLLGDFQDRLIQVIKNRCENE